MDRDGLPAPLMSQVAYVGTLSPQSGLLALALQGGRAGQKPLKPCFRPCVRVLREPGSGAASVRSRPSANIGIWPSLAGLETLFLGGFRRARRRERAVGRLRRDCR